MAQNSRELVKGLFEGKPIQRPPFSPWVCSFAAMLEQVPVKTMFSDPGILSRALSNTHKLFGYDVILNHFDPALEAEALGCEIEWQDDNWPPIITGNPLEHETDFYDLDTEGIEKKGRIPIILEATKRLILTKGKEVPIAAMITGPLTLAQYLKGNEFARQLELDDDESSDLVEDAGSICLKLCREYCELGIDIIVIAEDIQDLVIPDLSSVLASPLKSIFNVSRFYNVNSILISRVRDDSQAISLCSLGADAVSVSGNIATNKVKEKAREGNYRYSVTIPDSAFIGTDPDNTNLIENAVKSGVSGFFLSSEWEIPQDTDVNSMHRVMKIVRGEWNA
jgi:uroporphyrinogen-III decarboxylase